MQELSFQSLDKLGDISAIKKGFKQLRDFRIIALTLEKQMQAGKFEYLIKSKVFY